jgi:hypothetical protein
MQGAIKLQIVLVIPIFVNIRSKYSSHTGSSKILKTWERCTLDTYLAGEDPVANCGEIAPDGVRSDSTLI